MKKTFTISISEPCKENWSDFSSTNDGAFCSSCCKEVVDFSKMSETELTNYFKDQRGRVCGRFQKFQLKSYNIDNLKEPYLNLNWISAGLLGITLLSNPSKVKAELLEKNRVEVISTKSNDGVDLGVKDKALGSIKGRIVDETGEGIPGAVVYIKGTKNGTQADFYGYFELKGDFESGDILVVSFIGFDTVEYKIPNDYVDELIIPMLTMSCQLMGEVIIDNVYQEPTGIRRVWQKITGWI
ncbi:MAG: carboxypeptidase-like regulatory domain-containing protein [Cyclobacteriaceae bacterium]